MPHNIRVEFGPADHLNPGCGYQICIWDTDSGDKLLSTGHSPDTGEPIESAAECLRIAGMYADPFQRLAPPEPNLSEDEEDEMYSWVGALGLDRGIVRFGQDHPDRVDVLSQLRDRLEKEGY